jgi:carboxyl-terminal processing protease
MKFTDCFKRIPGEEILEKIEFTIEPGGEFLDRKIVILTNSKCLSSSELFILMLKETGRAITMGQTTGGGSGCPSSFPLHLGNRGFTLNVSTWRLTRNNGQVLENVGIEPNIPVEITPDDVINHRDVELEKAIEYLKSQK